ncbi:MAG: hypothetical protein F4187_03825, partial [Gemmatimonadetes bacterium]|nr:hypothetical protein [Gemmatimonadota bacterium]
MDLRNADEAVVTLSQNDPLKSDPSASRETEGRRSPRPLAIRTRTRSKGASMGNSTTKQTDRRKKGPTLLERHPLSKAFKDMPEMEFAALREDIRKRGVLEPITLLDGKVLDGWHRYTAAKEIDPGLEVPTVELGDRDPADLVISRNLHRRHLTATQRAVCVLE